VSEIPLAAVDAAILPYVHLGRSGLLPALHAAQAIEGWLPEPTAAHVAKALRIPLADVHGVIEFYSLFYNEPAGRNIHRVCTDIVCGPRGGDHLLDEACRKLGVRPNQPTADGEAMVEASPCLGLCEHAPASLVNVAAASAEALGPDRTEAPRPASIVGGSTRLLTARCGSGTTSLGAYGKYLGLERALTIGPGEVITEVKRSGLVGRGGAAFPTGVKWEGAASAPDRPKYVVCNADESEPGTFKDRVLLLDDPHLVLEGICIAAHAIGAERAYIYLRCEYPYILPVLESALAEARASGYLGRDFDIEIRLGAGAYICGEETALFESIEGKRGYPRIKPPFPTTYGLFGKPTVINNVETLCNIPLILRHGSDEYRRLGTEKSPGSKLFCLSGDVQRAGLYEVPFGLTLGELLDMAGGMKAGRELQAVLVGGAAGAFAAPNQLDTRLTFEDMRQAGLPLGSGVVLAFDETRDLRDVLRRLANFFAHESCGKCFPCQLGTQRQLEILDRAASGQTRGGDAERLQDVGWTMTDASLCGLGQTAATAVLSALQLWPDLLSAAPGGVGRA
jgi:NADH-quinone oxidoreductase subunit F